MRVPLSTDYKTRTGVPDKDARIKNGYVESRGEQSVVRKRPVARGGVEIGTGTAQGGIGLNIGGVDYIYSINGDIGALDTLESSGTNWDSSTIYPQGFAVSYEFIDYWSVDDELMTPNQNNNPSSGSDRWSITPTYCVTPTIPDPVIIGVSDSYTETATPPADVTLSDDIVGYYCAGILHKKVVVSYTVSAGTTAVSKVIGSGYDGVAHTGYGLTVTEAANDWFRQLIYTTCPGTPTTNIWLQSISSISSYVYCEAWSLHGGCPGAFDANVAAGVITTANAYTLTATITESYYLV